MFCLASKWFFYIVKLDWKLYFFKNCNASSKIILPQYCVGHKKLYSGRSISVSTLPWGKLKEFLPPVRKGDIKMIGTNKIKVFQYKTIKKKCIFDKTLYKEHFDIWTNISYYSYKKLQIYKIIYKLQRHVSIILLAVLSK